MIVCSFDFVALMDLQKIQKELRTNSAVYNIQLYYIFSFQLYIWHYFVNTGWTQLTPNAQNGESLLE